MKPYVLLAKQAVENYIKNGKVISLPKNLPDKFLNKKAGTFITITKNGQLRGCIGTYLPTKENVAQEIIHNAIVASTEDYRFGPIQEKELVKLYYEVYILDEPEQIQSFGELDPKRYGIIVKTVPENKNDASFNLKSALLLPNLEGLNTAKKQFSAACQKGEINPRLEKIAIYKFGAEKYSD